jgi:tryptophan-rich sensory protein
LQFVHLLILFVWPILFFKIEAFWAAFTLLLLLVFVTYMMMSRYYEASKAAFWILIPYCAWIAYALYLNLRVAMLN